MPFLCAMFLFYVPTISNAAGVVGVHEGVASCGGSTCHGRLAPTGTSVRQNELITWQDTTSAAGSHSQAWQVLTRPRAQAIASRMGLGRAQNAPACLGCHSDVASEAMRGTRFQISDGVGCESCHGGSGGWLASHYAVNATHAENVSKGMTALEDPKTRAGLCLDCHFGSNKPGQFVSHQMMAAGHPRLSFELDLFSALQRHYDFDADYSKRKNYSSGVKFWSVGQAMALERALDLYGSHGQDGAFPEFYFFDCQSCHRPISDRPDANLTVETNPARPIPLGMPPFDDQNMIMLSAVAQVVAPQVGAGFDRDVSAFHTALTQNRGNAAAAAAKLATSARALSNTFASRSFSRAEIFAVLDNVLSTASVRYSDYAGGAQAVMSADTLLNAMASTGQVDRGSVQALRPAIDQLYVAVRDPNNWRPAEFRDAIRQLASAVGRLK